MMLFSKVITFFLAMLAVVSVTRTMATSPDYKMEMVGEVGQKVQQRSVPEQLKTMIKERHLQSVVDELLDQFFEELLVRCALQIAATAIGDPSNVDLLLLAQCAVDVVIDLVDPCLRKFPGIWFPGTCIIQVEPAITSLLFSDSTDKLDEFLALFELAGVAQDVDRSSCEDLFGTPEDPRNVACVGLLNIADFDEFLDALKAQFIGTEGCGPMRNVLQLDEFDVDALVDEFELDDLKENFEVDFSEYFQNFNDCNEIFEGALETSLLENFTGSPAPVVIPGVLSIVAVLMLSFNLI